MCDAWQQPGSITGRQSLVALVFVSVQQDGNIAQKEIMRASGNSLMDISVMKAVDSVKGLPIPPANAGAEYKEITIDFEWSHSITHLADPFLVIKDGAVYFGFDDYEYYLWKGSHIYRKDPCLPLCLP